MVERREEVLRLTIEHMELTLAAVGLAALVGVPLGVLLTRRRALARWVLAAAGIIQTIPSLALLGFLLPIPVIGGIGKTPAIVALFLYSLFAIIRNTYTGIDHVDEAVRESARGMGMTVWQVLFMVQIPLALPMIMAGLRISSVICVGIATLCAAIGAGGLGQYIFRGISMVDNAMILAGAIPAAVLALTIDWLLGTLERSLSVQRSG
jgi:osmoprotectant transport system permease protein